MWPGWARCWISRPRRCHRAAMRRYIATMLASGMVAVGPAAREAVAALVHLPVLAGLSWRASSAVTRAVAVATLPPALRDPYGPLLAVGRRSLTGGAALLGRTLLPHLPAHLRPDPCAAIAIRCAARLGSQPISDMGMRSSKQGRGEISLPGLPVAARLGLSQNGAIGAPRSRTWPTRHACACRQCSCRPLPRSLSEEVYHESCSTSCTVTCLCHRPQSPSFCCWGHGTVEEHERTARRTDPAWMSAPHRSARWPRTSSSQVTAVSG
jgi:hypothetical protein